jgi:uncharacterized membrane protein YvbJ
MKRVFICEKCGRVVPHDTQRCMFCGKIFTGVRCPRCDFTGESSLFKNGCPVCGYTGRMREAGKKKSSHKKKTKRYISVPDGSGRSGKMLPLSVYKITGIVVFFLLVVLVVIIIRFYI